MKFRIIESIKLSCLLSAVAASITVLSWATVDACSRVFVNNKKDCQDCGAFDGLTRTPA